jgi:RecJ-like exonuclease
MKVEKYFCDTCAVFFLRGDLSETRESDTSEFWGAVEVTEGVVLECPACGGNVEERLPCLDCEAVLPQAGEDYCAPCMEVTDYVENWRAHKDAARARARFVYRAAESTKAEKTAAAVGIAVRLSGMLLLSKLFNGKK